MKKLIKEVEPLFQDDESVVIAAFEVIFGPAAASPRRWVRLPAPDRSGRMLTTPTGGKARPGGRCDRHAAAQGARRKGPLRARAALLLRFTPPRAGKLAAPATEGVDCSGIRPSATGAAGVYVVDA